MWLCIGVHHPKRTGHRRGVTRRCPRSWDATAPILFKFLLHLPACLGQNCRASNPPEDSDATSLHSYPISKGPACQHAQSRVPTWIWLSTPAHWLEQRTNDLKRFCGRHNRVHHVTSFVSSQFVLLRRWYPARPPRCAIGHCPTLCRYVDRRALKSEE